MGMLESADICHCTEPLHFMEEQSSNSHGWFAAFCAWMHETRPGTSLEEQLIATEEAFKPIVERALAQTGVAVDDSDVDACFDSVLRRIENKLERREFRVSLAIASETDTSGFHIISPGTRKVTFAFVVSDPGRARRGYMVRLSSLGRLVLEQEVGDEQFDSINSTLPVTISANSLKHGYKYRLDLNSRASGLGLGGQDFTIVRQTALHLLRAQDFTIILCDSDLSTSRRYTANFRDTVSEADIARRRNLVCNCDGTVTLDIAYDCLPDQHDIRIELTADGEGPPYYCYVRPVRHETWEARRGYIAQVTRTVASERIRSKSNRSELSLDSEVRGVDLAGVRSNANDHERERFASIRYQQAIKTARTLMRRLPDDILAQLIEHEVEGRSWAEIAAQRHITEVKAKKDCSRSLMTMAERIAPEPETDRKGVVKWLKEGLSEILGF
jgi:DNA-directed RNA polymerase specialized sigma24 family protein